MEHKPHFICDDCRQHLYRDSRTVNRHHRDEGHAGDYRVSEIDPADVPRAQAILDEGRLIPQSFPSTPVAVRSGSQSVPSAAPIPVASGPPATAVHAVPGPPSAASAPAAPAPALALRSRTRSRCRPQRRPQRRPQTGVTPATSTGHQAGNITGRYQSPDQSQTPGGLASHTSGYALTSMNSSVINRQSSYSPSAPPAQTANYGLPSLGAGHTPQQTTMDVIDPRLRPGYVPPVNPVTAPDYYQQSQSAHNVPFNNGQNTGLSSDPPPHHHPDPSASASKPYSGSYPQPGP